MVHFLNDIDRKKLVLSLGHISPYNKKYLTIVSNDVLYIDIFLTIVFLLTFSKTETDLKYG